MNSTQADHGTGEGCDGHTGDFGDPRGIGDTSAAALAVRTAAPAPPPDARRSSRA
ncbi:hypothetical protein [Streptomyces naganishii]|uniref:hypothetical protein n=1 Tax=Streptomyces naganishii TaxID=285447 RepID=UPI001E6352B3|nr:hypothetical protein [Streptomyces naganishii]